MNIFDELDEIMQDNVYAYGLVYTFSTHDFNNQTLCELLETNDLSTLSKKLGSNDADVQKV